MIRILSLTLVLIVAQFSGIPLAQAENRSAKALKTELHLESDSVTLEGHLEAGYHFNEKAPNEVQTSGKKFKPELKNEHEIFFKKLPLHGEALVRLYVCDDALTFCETNTLKLKLEEAHKTRNSTSVADESISEVVQTAKNKVDKTLEKKHLGFWQNNLTAGFREANSKNSLVLIDFGARWCPSCVRLDKEIFANSEFQKSTSQLSKVKIDVDLINNANLLTKYSINGFPTVLITNAKGQEILRFTDFQPMPRILQLIAEAEKNPLPIPLLRKRAETQGSQADWLLLWNRYFLTENYDEALKILIYFRSPPEWVKDAQVEAALQHLKKNEIPWTEATQKVTSVIASEARSTRSLRWRAELVESLMNVETKTPDERKDLRATVENYAKQCLDLALEFSKDPESLKAALQYDQPGEFSGYDKFYVLFTAAEAMETAQLEPETRAQAVWAAAFEVGKSIGITASTPGISLRWLTSAIQSNQSDEALQIVDEMLEKSPTEVDLLRRKLKILVLTHKFEDALKIGEVALKNSYGMNEWMVLESYLQALLGARKIELARDLLKNSLSRSELKTERLKNLKLRLLAMQKAIEKTKNN